MSSNEPESRAADDLWQRLGASRLPASDFSALLFDYFKTSQAVGSVVTYGADTQPLLRLHYKGDALRRVEPGPELTDADIDTIAAAVDRETHETKVYIRRAILFACAPTTGWFRYRDTFQLLPVPPDAPRPPYLLADHPFVAEFPVRHSEISGIRVTRESVAEQDVRLLLGGLLWFRVTGRRWRHHGSWVSSCMREDGTTAPPNEGVHFAIHHYGFDGFEERATDFSPADGLAPVPVEPDDGYYGRTALDIDDVLSVPESLPSLLDAYYALNEQNRAKVLRACYWLVHSHEVYNLSVSAAFASLVQAIEALLPDSRRGTPCPECRRPAGPGPTRLFQDFLQHCVPDIDGKARQLLYEVRSEIVHGGRLLRIDRPPLLWSLTPDDAHERQLFETVRAASQRGLVAWLQR